jgi:ATPase subunit of ABC transporter with duplicated ATPase domains
MTQRLLQLDHVSFNLPDGRVLLDHLNHTFSTRATGIVFGYAAPINLTLTGPMRMAILGANGSGKSTLLRVIAGQLPVRQGELIRSCHVGWLDQVQWLYESNPELPEAEARTRLAQMGIDADRAMLKTCRLSGGERLKIVLAAQFYARRPPQLLLLDEPDNHLDLPSRIALEQMLNQYQGALIVVSHDCAFLQAIHLDAELHLKSQG